MHKKEYDKKDIEINEKFDFYGGNERMFYQKKQYNSVLSYGCLSKKIPLVTIIIPTYKRVGTLKQAINSALNQKNFDDYEILVVDNEGSDIREETETSTYIKELQSDRIIYYRHEKTEDYAMDSACRLARTKWILFLHDDDILDDNILYILFNIAKNNPQKSWISCTIQPFMDKESDIVTQGEGKSLTEKGIDFEIVSLPPQFCCVGYAPGWLGALIDREKYIGIGGTPILKLGMGDLVMQGSYAYHYKDEICLCKTNIPLYHYRIWEGQLSAAGSVEWYNNYINQFLYYRYCACKYHTVTKKYWEYIGWQLIKDAIDDRNNGYYKCNIDEEKMRNLLGVPARWSHRGIVYQIFYLILKVYHRYWTERSKEDKGIIVLP